MELIVLVVLSHVQLCDSVDCSLPGFSARGVSQAQESSSGLLFPSPGDLQGTQGLEPMSPASPALAGALFTTSAPGKPRS